MLAAHLAAFPPGDHGLIFTTASGSAVPRSNWSDAYRAACAEAGIAGRTRTHDLRHVTASSMIAAGLSVAAVQAALGHSSPAETLEVYTHLWPTDEERTREAIEVGSGCVVHRGQVAADCVASVSRQGSNGTSPLVTDGAMVSRPVSGILWCSRTGDHPSVRSTRGGAGSLRLDGQPIPSA